MKKYNIVWFIEHISRELDVACAVKTLLEKQSEKRVLILPFNQSKKPEYILNLHPELVLLPYSYSINDSGLAPYIKVWPDALYINLAWEQIFYEANLEYKVPRDVFSKKFVWHHTWSKSRKKFLIDRGVNSNHIFSNGHPTYRLYDLPYKKLFTKRNELAKKFGLNPKKKWIFFPENYSWYFYSDHNLKEIIRNGQSPEIAYIMRDYCGKSFKTVMTWINNLLEKNKELELILRPRPAVTLLRFENKTKKIIKYIPNNLHILKDLTVREWILSSDITISSFSTSLIEASIAKKPIYMLEPYKTPQALSSSWYTLVPKIKEENEIFKICSYDQNPSSYRKLNYWARKEFLSGGDPIKKLVQFLKNIKKDNNSDQEKYLMSFMSKQHRDLIKKSTTGIKNILGKLKNELSGNQKLYLNDDEDLYYTEIRKRSGIYKKLLI